MRINFSSFGGGFDFPEVILEVYIEDKAVQRQQMQAPEQMLIMNFIQLAEQIKKDKRPMKIKMIRPEVIWDSFEQQQKVFNNEIEIRNDAMSAWEENRKGAD